MKTLMIMLIEEIGHVDCQMEAPNQAEARVRGRWTEALGHMARLCLSRANRCS